MELGLNKMPWYGQILLFVVLAGGSVYGYHYFYANDQEVALAKKETDLRDVRARITKGMAIAQQLPMFQAEVIKLETHLEGLKQVLPEQRDVGDMLRRIQTLAAQSSLDVRNFRPQKVANKELHAEWPMQLELEGTYHNLGLFFDRVSKVPRIINVNGIDIKSVENRRDQPVDATITARCVATTFVLLDKPADTAGETAKGKKPARTPAAAR